MTENRSLDRQKLLYLKAADDYPDYVNKNLEQVCSMLGIEFFYVEMKSLVELDHYFSEENGFNYLFLEAHATPQDFGDNSGVYSMRWADLSTVLCGGPMADDSILFLGCCKGGSKKISLALFCNCQSLTTVCGPRWDIDSKQIPVAIHVFLHNLIRGHQDPHGAADRASAALGCGFPLHYRYDMECEIYAIQTSGLDDYMPKL